ncbi:MAG: hypothetical protein O4804_17025 [Trichodesmium sp. St11_bin5]|nr:hypothetical protein [Trichodesmium sp. St11_bin5]
MKKLSSRVHQYVFIHLAEAFNRFFAFGMLRKQGLGKYPRFKKKGKYDSWTIDNCGKPIELNGWSHKLPFIGIVKTYEPWHRQQQKKTLLVDKHLTGILAIAMNFMAELHQKKLM